MCWEVKPLDKHGWLLVIFVALFSAGIRFWNLAEPPEMYFDEVYYAKAATEYVNMEPDSNTVHPPLGKMQIALGILACNAAEKLSGGRLVIPEPFKWRFSSAVLGSILPVIVFFMAYHVMRGNRSAALLAEFFVSIDFMAYTLSRISMLDIVLAVWITLGAYLAWRALEESWNGTGKFWRYCVYSALAFAVSAACKWSGLFGAFGAFWMLVCYSAPNYRPGAEGEDGAFAAREGKFWQRLLQAARGVWPVFWKLVLVFGALTVIIYLASYVFLYIREGWGAFESIAGYHKLMFGFRYDSKQFTHHYMSQFWSWPLVLRPVWLYYESAHGLVEGIVCFGSVVFWWTALMYIIETCASGIARKDASMSFAAWLWVPQWILWASSTTGGFIYYMLPGVPFLALAASMVISDWLEQGGKVMVVCYITAISVFFMVYFPFLGGFPASENHFDKIFPVKIVHWR